MRINKYNLSLWLLSIAQMILFSGDFFHKLVQDDKMIKFQPKKGVDFKMFEVLMTQILLLLTTIGSDQKRKQRTLSTQTSLNEFFSGRLTVLLILLLNVISPEKILFLFIEKKAKSF